MRAQLDTNLKPNFPEETQEKPAPHNILLIQGDSAEAIAVQEALTTSNDGPFQVEWVKSCTEGLEWLTKNGAQGTDNLTAVLVDLFLPDCEGIETFNRLFHLAPHIPILVLSTSENEEIAKAAVQNGAHDYFLKGRVDSYLLPKALHEMIKRSITAEAMFSESERAQITLNAIGDAVLSTDAEGNVIYLNKMAEKMTGWSRIDAIGHAVQEVLKIVNNVTRTTVPNPMPLAMQQNKPVLLAPGCVLMRRDGTEITIADCATPVHSRRGQVIGAVMVFRDISTAHTLSLSVLQAQKMEAVGNLTGGMAHDFNNLLSIIIGNLDILCEKLPNDSEEKSLLQAALEAALRGADLTQRLLAFARQQPLKPQRVDVNKLTEGITKLLGRTIGEDITISLNLQTDIWPVIVDPVQLEAALTNLAMNARDAMPNGGVLTITTRNSHLNPQNTDTTHSDYVAFEVTDNGTGMSPEILARIFEPFFTTKERGKGTGLGLAMVFGFVKQSGGNINVKSKINSGTTFQFFLPRAKGVLAAAAQAPAQQTIVNGHENILVVEDNGDVRQIVTRQLVGLGYHVLEAESASEALALLTSGGQVDLLFTDIVMPGKLNGLELAHVAVERWPNLKVILTSGFPETKINGHATPIKGMRLLSKPYRKADLASILRETLDL